MKTVEPTHTLLTIHEVALIMRVDDSTVRRWITIGALEAVALPRHGNRKQYRVRLATLEQLLKTSK